METIKNLLAGLVALCFIAAGIFVLFKTLMWLNSFVGTLGMLIIPCSPIILVAAVGLGRDIRNAKK